MKDQDQNSLLDEWLAPYALFFGIAISFGACCATGFRLTQSNCFENFERFHTFINPQTGFNPTASQVRALARSEIAPDKIAVIVGGSSVMYGDGQGPDLWTNKLQEFLGDQYKVMNFGMRGACSGEFGAVAAETLSSDYKRLIFISHTWPGTAAGPAVPDGYSAPFQKFYWDAHYKGLLARDSAREERIRELSVERKNDDKFAEMRREMQLDSCLNFHQLWTTLAYTHISTVWNPSVRPSMLRPRKAYRDPNRVHYAQEQRYPAGAYQADVFKGIRATIQGNTAAASTLFFEQTFKLCFPDPFRQRTVVVVTPNSPYYLDQLEPAERTSYAAISPATVQLLEKMGFTGVDMSTQLSCEGDFVDQVHLSEEGGRKMAEEVATKVRDLAYNLGYLSERPPFTGWNSAQGLAPIEGPYPQWQLPRVRWGTGKQTQLRFISKPDVPLCLSIACRSGAENQSLTVLLDGKQLFTQSLPDEAKFTEIDIPLPATTPGEHELKVQYSTYDVRSEPRRVTVLYQRLQLVPATEKTPVATKDNK